jgi:DAACS family dicarboxylate/amino acid:cation (Na+ or H+) symporter
MVAALLAAFGIQPEGIGIILGVERLLDMTRTMVNVGSDVVTTIVVDRYTALAEAPRTGS